LPHPIVPRVWAHLIEICTLFNSVCSADLFIFGAFVYNAGASKSLP